MTKFRFLKDIASKLTNPNAQKLMQEIKDLLAKGNEPRAKVMMSRFRKRYGKLPFVTEDDLYEQYLSGSITLNEYSNSEKLENITKSSFQDGTILLEDESDFKKLKDNKIKLDPEERKECLNKKAVWHFNDGSPSPAVWKSKDPKTGKIMYITNTHRAYQARPTLKGSISIFHSFIKGTA